MNEENDYNSEILIMLHSVNYRINKNAYHRFY